MSTFTYHPVPPELRDLAEELESLGGGEARVGQLEVVARIRPEIGLGASGGGDNCTIVEQRSAWAEGNVVTLSAPHTIAPATEKLGRANSRAGSIAAGTSPTTATVPALRNHRVSLALPPEASNATLCRAICGNVLDWLCDGFNGTVVAMGESGAEDSPSSAAVDVSRRRRSACR